MTTRPGRDIRAFRAGRSSRPSVPLRIRRRGHLAEPDGRREGPRPPSPGSARGRCPVSSGSRPDARNAGPRRRIFRRNARTAVLDRQDGVARLLRQPDADAGVARVAGVFHGVVDEVGERLADELPVAGDVDVRARCRSTTRRRRPRTAARRARSHRRRRPKDRCPASRRRKSRPRRARSSGAR